MMFQERMKRIISERMAVVTIAVFAVIFVTALFSLLYFISPSLNLRDPLTPEERAWLNEHDGKIRMAPIPSWEPMEILDEEGNYSGLVGDFLKLIEKKMNFRFKLLRVDNWAEILEMAERGEIDVLGAAKPTPKRREYMIWSEPYLDIPNVIVTRKSVKGELTLDRMTGMKVGVTRGYVVVRFLEENYPDLELVKVVSDLEGLRMVSFNELDAFIVDTTFASHTIEQEMITNLKVAGDTDYRAIQSIGVRKDWPLFLSIVSKGIAMITPEERQKILGKWTYLAEYPEYYNRKYWYMAISAIILVSGFVGLVLSWNLTLQRKVRSKTRELTQELSVRKRIAVELSQSRQRLATLIGNFPGMAYRHYYDPDSYDWPMEYTSPGGHDLTGYEHLHGPGFETLYFDEVVHPGDREKIRTVIIDAVNERKPFHLIYRIRTRDGKKKWVWEQGVGIYNADGDIDCIEGFATDITNFKNAEESLSKSHKLFQDLVVNSPIGISIVRDNRVVYRNPEQQALFGELPEGYDLLSRENVHPADAERAGEFFESFAKEGKKLRETELRIFKYDENGPSSRKKWVHCRATRIEYQGKPSTLLIMVDITFAKELEHIVSVKDKMSSLGRVAAGMAHEIRNPLSGIYIYLSAIERAFEREEKEKQEARVMEKVGLIREASSDIETVIRRVMDFAKPGTPSFTTMDLNGPLKQARNLSAVFLRKNRIRLETCLSEEKLLCHADSNLIQRVVLNLITNAAEAMKHMDTGKRLRLESGREDGVIHIAVSDSGPGVPKSILEAIFDPFYTTKSDGTGIGLSLSQRIIADHMGEVRVEESDLGGARFVVELPLKQVEETA